jgi:5-methylcytosine-specific restriction endonuclease McrA
MPQKKRKAPPVKVTYADGRTELKKAARFTAQSKAARARGKPYWATEAWRKRRRAVLERDDHRCVDCGRKQGDEDPRLKRGRARLEVHHLTYERYGHELLEDLLTVCQRCHSIRHQWLGREKRARQS